MTTKPQPKLTKRQKRSLRNDEQQASVSLLDIIPLTQNQRKTFNAFHMNKNLFLHGVAGTGKTFISIYLSLKEIFRGYYDKIVIYRSVVPSRDMGFLPGSAKEKARVYEMPYHGICARLFNRPDAYDYLKSKGMIEFESTSFVRGITLENCIVLIDEMQNLGSQEFNSIITRVGDNCRVIFCGDIRQNDLDRRKEKSGLSDFYKIIDHMPSFESVEFTVDDVVRSKLVKEYILTRLRLEDEGHISSLSV
jgi:phosphate starvation-inducible protein PhoH and related proteins